MQSHQPVTDGVHFLNCCSASVGSQPCSFSMKTHPRPPEAKDHAIILFSCILELCGLSVNIKQQPLPLPHSLELSAGRQFYWVFSPPAPWKPLKSPVQLGWLCLSGLTEANAAMMDKHRWMEDREVSGRPPRLSGSIDMKIKVVCSQATEWLTRSRLQEHCGEALDSWSNI